MNKDISDAVDEARYFARRNGSINEDQLNDIALDFGVSPLLIRTWHQTVYNSDILQISFSKEYAQLDTCIKLAKKRHSTNWPHFDLRYSDLVGKLVDHSEFGKLVYYGTYHALNEEGQTVEVHCFFQLDSLKRIGLTEAEGRQPFFDFLRDLS